MAFYYFKDDGVAIGTNGRSVVPRTGTWTSDTSQYYGTLGEAISAGPVAGDILVASSASRDLSNVTASETVPNGVMLVVVDDSAIDQYLPATDFLVENSSGNPYAIEPQAGVSLGSMVRGFKWRTGSNIALVPLNAHGVWFDCEVEQNRFGRDFSTGGRGACAKFVNCDFKWTSATDNGLLLWTADKTSMLGGSVSVGSGAASHIENLNYGPNGAFIGVDFSAGKENIPLIKYGTSTAYQQSTARFVRCPLPAGWSFENEDTTNRLYGIVQHSDSQYQYAMECYAGAVDFVTDIFYTSHAALSDEVTKGSFELGSNANTNHISPLYAFDISDAEIMSAINSNAATNPKVRLRFAVESGDSLDGSDVGAIVLCPKPGAPWQAYVVQHYEAPLGAGTTLPTETGAWTNNRGGFTLGTQHYLDIDMGAPADGVVSVIPIVFKPNVTVLFSGQLEFVP